MWAVISSGWGGVEALPLVILVLMVERGGGGGGGLCFIHPCKHPSAQISINQDGSLRSSSSQIRRNDYWHSADEGRGAAEGVKAAVGEGGGKGGAGAERHRNQTAALLPWSSTESQCFLSLN